MGLRFSRRAARELTAIFSRIARDDPSAASRVTSDVERSAAILAARPGLGRPTRLKGLYAHAIPGRPYTIFFRRAADGVEIVSVRHQRRRPLA